MSNFKTFITCVMAVAAVTSVAAATFCSKSAAFAADMSMCEESYSHTESFVEHELEVTDWYSETEYGSYIVTTEFGQFETVEHPTQLELQKTVCKPVAAQNTVEIAEASVEVATVNEPCVLETFDATTFQVNKSYFVPVDFYYDTLPEDMHCLVEGICNLEATQDISSMFLFAVAATEVGWSPDFAGENNWFNWTPDAADYQDFESTDACIEYTGTRFEECFFNPEWHAIFGATVDDYFTISEINSRYAFYNDGTVNTYWGEVVSEIVESMHFKYKDWVENNG